MRTALIVCGVIVALAACGKSDKDKSDESDKSKDPASESSKPETPAATDAAAAKAETTPMDAAPAAPQTDEEKAAQCAAILDKSWKQAAPGYAKAGVEVTPELEKQYRESYDTRKFLEKCPTVTRAYRDCMEAAANPIENADPCNAKLEGQPQLGRPMMPAPRVEGESSTTLVSSLFKRPAIDAGAKRSIVSRLTGTWVSKTPFGVETWTIAAGGKVTEVRERNGNAEEPKKFRIEPATDTTVNIVYDSNDQTRGFHMLSDKEFLCQGNLMWMPSYIGDGTKFTALKDFDAVFYDNGACEVLTAYGSLLPATCAFAEREGKRYFDVTYQVPGKVKWRTTDPEPTKGAFLVSGEYLIPEKLLDSLYVKQ